MTMHRAAGRGRLLALAVLALAWTLATPAMAQLSVDDAIVDFDAADQRRTDVEVRNTGEETLYVSVTPRLVANPGTPDERRVEIKNPRDLGLLTAPRKMILEPGQRRLLRISLLDRPRDDDRIYRVAVTPEVGETQRDQSGVRVLLGYNLLVMARPPEAEAEITGERDGKTLVLRNRGRTNALLVEGEQCAPGGSPCQDLPSRRLYAGNRWEVDLPYATEARWNVRTRDSVQARAW
jgi:P pilus assembly chaperone PapD